MQSGQQSAAAGALTPETPAPEVILELAGGGEVALSAHLGKPVMLVFWATWCGACREEMPDLDRLTREANGRYAVIMASRESPSVLARFAAARRLVVPMGSDRSGQAFSAYRIESLPTTVIINAEGRIVHDFVGGASYEALREHLGRLAGQ
jgi:peroxiredoxin